MKNSHVSSKIISRRSNTSDARDHSDYFINNVHISIDFKMPIDLYQLTGSPPCRTVRLAAAAIGVDLNLKNVDLKAGEHLKSEFIKVIL